MIHINVMLTLDFVKKTNFSELDPLHGPQRTKFGILEPIFWVRLGSITRIHDVGLMVHPGKFSNCGLNSWSVKIADVKHRGHGDTRSWVGVSLILRIFLCC